MSYPLNHMYSYAQYPQPSSTEGGQGRAQVNGIAPPSGPTNHPAGVSNLGIVQPPPFYNAQPQIIPPMQFQPPIPSIMSNPGAGSENFNADDPNMPLYNQHHQQYNNQYNQQRIPPMSQESSPPVLYPPNVQIPIEQKVPSQPQPHQQPQFPTYNPHIINYQPSYNFPPYSNTQFVSPYPTALPYSMGQAQTFRHPYHHKAGAESTQHSTNIESVGLSPYAKPFPFNYVDNQGENLLPSESKAIHFKPIKTKKNSRPRIQKLNKNELAVEKLNMETKPAIEGELSNDQLLQHFMEELKIERPVGNHGKAGGTVESSHQLKLKSELECQLLDLYLLNISKCFDVFVPQEAFGKIIPELALYDETNMLLDSIFCLSSLVYQRTKPDKIDASIPLKYYHQSIKSVRYHLSIPGVINNKGIISRCLVSTIFLCVYELFFVAIDSTYIKGATSILSTILSKQEAGSKSLLKNSPFHQSCFWVIFYCDLILSVKYSLPSMYSIEEFWKPLDPEFCESYESYNDSTSSNPNKARADSGPGSNLTEENSLWWLHKSIINFSLINQFNNQVVVLNKDDFESNKPFYSWLEFKTLIEEFEMKLPTSLKPIIYKPTSQTRVFPLVYFKDEMTAIMCLNFKSSQISLYEGLILKTNTEHEIVQPQLLKYCRAYAVKVAKDIIGIMKTYDTNKLIWPDHIHTIRFVALYVKDEPKAFKEYEKLKNRIILSTSNIGLNQKIFRENRGRSVELV